MEVTYRRNMGCNYIILQEGETETRDTYQMHILLENQVPGLLLCKVQRMNGQDLFYYEITGCQNLVNLFENRKFKKADIAELFTAVIKIMECLDKYLMNRDFLLLQPAYVYKNMEKQSYVFLWFPFSRDTIESEFRKLTEYILPRIDHSDKAAVTIGYGIYKESMEDSIQIESLKAQLYLEREEMPERVKVQSELFHNDSEEEENERERQKILDDFYKEEEEEQAQSYNMIGIAMILVLLIAVFFLVRHLRFLADIYIWIVTGVLIAAGAASGAIWYMWYWKKKKSEEEEKKVGIKEVFYEEDSSGTSLDLDSKTWNKEGDEETGMTVLLQEQIHTGACLQEADRDPGRRYFLQKETSLIGKWKESVDIWLDVPTVSRIHAKIVHREQGDYLIDLNSRNGTLLNGKYLDPEIEYKLEDKSIIVFAQVKFYYFVRI